MVALPRSAVYALKPEPSSIEGNVGVYDVNIGEFIIILFFALVLDFGFLSSLVEKPLNVKMMFADQFSFRKPNPRPFLKIISMMTSSSTRISFEFYPHFC